MPADRPVNILLVEDDEVGIMNVKRALRKNNLTNSLYVAANGLEALSMLGKNETQLSIIPAERRLILLDLNMPKMGGIEFLQELRADPALRSIPVVVLTTSDRDQDRTEAYHLNVAGYLLKPVTFNAFAELIATLNHYWALCEMP
ncbi:MAG: response regulator [Leptolyngbyaceae cyanobacterium]